ncbi:MAG: SWIM zinc finger family protein [Dehalococcoidia bacterium]|nr:SWIM zinc finger family protein [Dehalococcoidia bacterium]
MQSSLIGKIEKAHRYAQEPERITINEFSSVFRGANDDHSVRYSKQQWSCTCSFFRDRGLCAHTMAMEKVLDNMLPAEARTNFDTAEETP